MVALGFETAREHRRQPGLNDREFFIRFEEEGHAKHVEGFVDFTQSTDGERRSLEANRRAAFERLGERLRKLNFVPKKRKATRPSKGSVERRLSGKSHASRTKAARRRPLDD
jgi:hypothetical protein